MHSIVQHSDCSKNIRAMQADSCWTNQFASQSAMTTYQIQS